MKKYFFTFSILLTLAVFISLMGWFSLKIINMEKEKSERVQNDEYENELNLTIWQLELSALAIYNSCIAEITDPTAPKVYSQKYTLIKNRLSYPIPEAKKNNSSLSTEKLLCQAITNNAITPPVQEKGKLALPISKTKNVKSKFEKNTSWSHSRKNADYNTRSNNVLQQKLASQKLLYNEAPSANKTKSSVKSSPPLLSDYHLNPFQVKWLEGNLYLLRNIEQDSKLETVQLNHTEILKQLTANHPNIKLKPHKHTFAKINNNRLELIHTENLPYTENTLVALPYQVHLPKSSPKPIETQWLKNLMTLWAVFFLFIMLAALFIFNLRKLSQRRSQFVSSVTHELRTPLTSFQLYTEMLKEGLIQAEEKKQEYYNTLHREAKRLSHLIENVLTYSKLEKNITHTQDVNLSKLLIPVQNRLQERISITDAKLKVVNQIKKEITFTTDPIAVEQILFNLIDNACKYALDKNSTQTISLSITTQTNKLLFTLSDQGPGISKKEQKKLFSPFHKTVVSAADSAKPGVGLGLSIAKRQAKMLGGSLKLLHSTSGAVFELSLPL